MWQQPRTGNGNRALMASCHFQWAVGHHCCNRCPYDQESQICHWNFNTVCHSFAVSDISISDFGCRITISGCQLLLQSLADTFLELFMVINDSLQICCWNFNAVRDISNSDWWPFLVCQLSSKSLSLNSSRSIFLALHLEKNTFYRF